MEPKTGKQVHIIMGSGYPKDGSVSAFSCLQTSQKIVSKQAYVQARIVQTGAYLAGLCLFLLCGLLVLTMLFTGIAFMLGGLDRVFCPPYEDSFTAWQTGGYLSLFLLSIIGAYSAGRASKVTLTHAVKLDLGIPLTRANSSHLPAPDSLVRASSEPVQAQEAVLLRAAAEGQETPPEQLVRASVGQE